jgi:hypothetical protein
MRDKNLPRFPKVRRIIVFAERADYLVERRSTLLGRARRGRGARQADGRP